MGIVKRNERPFFFILRTVFKNHQEMSHLHFHFFTVGTNAQIWREINFSVRLFKEIFKLCVTVDRSGSTKLEKMIKEKSFLLLLLSATRIEERQLNFFVHGPFVPPFSLKRKLL